MSEPPCKKICLSENLENDVYKNVGIDTYLSEGIGGFSGQIKERWEDFIVNEVDLQGNIVIYTGDGLPNDVIKEINEEEIKNQHISEEVINKLIECSNSVENKEVSFDASEDKAIRSEIYKFIKLNFKNLFGNTEIRNDKKVFVITNYSDERSKIAQRNEKQNGKDQYCQFVLYKEGKDTISAIALLAKYLRINPGSFTYAGTKDKRGITTQLVTVRGCAAERLKGLNKCLRGVTVGNFQYVKNPLKLGDLYGNRFKLVIRDVCGSDDNIINSIEQFKKGFVNYFGLQRFGSTETRSHDIGKLAIASKWEEMIKLILEPTPQDLPFMRDCKIKFKENGDCDDFLKNSSTGIERSIVMGISRHGYTLNALSCLPRNLRQLYVHSFQSFIWNTMASKRIKDFGNDKVLVGDLVEKGDDIMVLSESDLENFKFEDIILPLPGYDIQLPKNEVSQWYTDILAEYGLDLEKLRHRVKEFSLPGAYRRIISVPTDITYNIHYYDDANLSLIETDYEKVTGSFIFPKSEGSKKAVIIEFTLQKSSYATIAIRELLREIKVFQ